MSEMNSIQLKTSCILNVPLQSYDNFTFIVNGEEFKTTRLIADIISPIISKMHMNDPSFDTYTINTTQQGDFKHILNLSNFNKNQFPQEQLPFILDIINQLGNESIEFQMPSIEITRENVFTLLQQHKKNMKIFSSNITKECDFIASLFHELCENYEEELSKLSVDTLSQIINNDKIRLKSEDQLLKFVNKLYSENSAFSPLYESILFTNVSPDVMREFISLYDVNDINGKVWYQLAKRLEREIERKSKTEEEVKKINNVRYNSYEIKLSANNQFNGIINYLGRENGVIITSSSISSDSYRSENVVSYESNNYFESNDSNNSWICFDFKDHRINPTHYTLKSGNDNSGGKHPKDWIIQGSNDKNSWEIIDERSYNSTLNGPRIVATFEMNKKNTKEFKYIRMCLNSNHANRYVLSLSSFEIFGILI